MYAAAGVAVLGKGPVGIILPLGALGLYLLLTGGWRNIFRSAWAMRPVAALVVVGAIVVPWCVLVQQQTGGRWLPEFLINFNLRPFRQPIQTHGDVSFFRHGLDILASVAYCFYHVPSVLVGFFPWSVFLGPAIVQAVRGLRQKPAKNVLATCWFGVWFVFWSVCKTKLPHYLLPAYPALALLVACWIDRWLADPATVARHWLRNAWISTVVVGAGMMVAIPIVAAYFLPGEGSLGLLGAILVLGGAWCWRATARNEHRQAVVVFTATSVVFLTAVFGFAAMRVDRHQNAKPMIAAICADWAKIGGHKAGGGERPGDCPDLCVSKNGTAPLVGGGAPLPPIATYGPFRESTVFYAGRPVVQCSDDPKTGRTAQQRLADFVANSPHGYVVTSDDCLPELETAFPCRSRVIFRHPRFLQPAPAEMVVLRFDRAPASHTTLARSRSEGSKH